VIGLTGAFGGGCTTVAWHLTQLAQPYLAVKLSDEVRAEWRQRGMGGKESRERLQKLGDELREKHGNHVLAERALRTALSRTPRPHRTALDGLRNLGEVRWLQGVLGENFALFAIYADPTLRWERVRAQYKSESQFQEDDQRDQGEDEEWGQLIARSGKKMSSNGLPQFSHGHGGPGFTFSFLPQNGHFRLSRSSCSNCSCRRMSL
jgi:dephospho-CoA kinase